ncbi:sentrin-specific protease 7-like [Xenia sp. Carnegie-2017]|uniref:sentrin-specific protease 7-like n=1 Tax=Xenia sp. Carnegie-2017 TaxID=2897299 RepID=UPI001F047CB7|nr:sentrin-specific protease 7-like [Xenia sp. Carnegie-2017]
MKQMNDKHTWYVGRSTRYIIPKVPQQPNSVDCGVYVMKFAEMLIKEPLTGEMLMKIPDFRQSFDHAEISAMRERVKSLLSTL